MLYYAVVAGIGTMGQPISTDVSVTQDAMCKWVTYPHSPVAWKNDTALHGKVMHAPIVPSGDRGGKCSTLTSCREKVIT